MNEPILSHEIAFEEAAFRAGVRAGIEDADAGRTVAFEKVKAWLLSWGKPDELPPPE